MKKINLVAITLMIFLAYGVFQGISSHQSVANDNEWEIYDLKSQVRDLDSRIDGMRYDVRNLDDKIDDLESDVDDLDRKIRWR